MLRASKKDKENWT